jgi:hypothetical protein
MKRYHRFLYFIIAAGSFFSCQHELFFDPVPPPPSAGLLQDSSGDCLPKNVAGTYKMGINTGDTNFIEVTVRVTRVGAYSIATDTLNGYYFKSSGNFPDTGLRQVKLNSAGIPLVAGTDAFTVHYDNDNCVVNINVLSNVVPPVPPAVYTLSGAPGNCTPFIIAGSYVKDVSVNADDSVIVELNVSAAGKYHLETNEVNGYSFYAKGVVEAGLQKVTLYAIGIPLQQGTDVFTLTSGGSSCSFSVNVSNYVKVTGLDYFPLTTNSYWTYDDITNRKDTVIRKITDSLSVGNALYHTMHEYDQYGGDKEYNFSRTDTGYFQYGRADILTVAFSFRPEVIGRINFLNHNLTKGASWKSDEFKGTMNSGETIYLQYNYYCENANTVLTVNNNTFINVYHVVLLPQVRSAFGPYNSTSEKIDLYYARGVGIIYLYATNNAGYLSKELKLRYWKVY